MAVIRRGSSIDFKALLEARPGAVVMAPDDCLLYWWPTNPRAYERCAGWVSENP